MVTTTLSELALNLFADLQNPKNRGLAGSILLTKLRRTLAKLEKQGPLPAGLSKITPERLTEIREANLIASADIALDKARDETRPIENRLEQLVHAAHYIKTADCGWQIVGMTERKYIDLQFALMCAQIKTSTKPTEEHYIRHLKETAERFLIELLAEDSISQEDFNKFSQTLGEAAKEGIQTLRKNAYATALNIVNQVKNGEVPDTELVERLQHAHYILNISGKRDEEAVSLFRNIGDLVRAYRLNHYKARYHEAVGKKGIEAADALDEISTELQKNDLSWEDLDLNQQGIEEQSLAFAMDGVAIWYAEAQQLFAVEKYQDAWDFLRKIRVYAGYNFEKMERIKIKPEDAEKFYKNTLKAKINSDFNVAIQSDQEARSILADIHRAERELEKENLAWQDVNPSLTPTNMETIKRPLNERYVRDSLASYKDTGNIGWIWDMAAGLDNLRQGWSYLETLPGELAALAAKYGHSLPRLGRDAA